MTTSYDVWIRTMLTKAQPQQSLLILVAPSVQAGAAHLFLRNVAIRAQEHVDAFHHEDKLSPAVLFGSAATYALLAISKSRKDAVLCCFDSVLQNASVTAMKQIFVDNKSEATP